MVAHIDDCRFSHCRYAPLSGFDTRAMENVWLSPRETRRVSRIRDGGRRAAWVMARVVAKQLLRGLGQSRRTSAGQPVSETDFRPKELEIDSGPCDGPKLQPRIYARGSLVPLSISIAHTRQGVLVAVARDTRVRVGVDLLEPVELSPGFRRWWFSQAESHAAAGRGHDDAAMWAIKEAVYKAVNRGEPFVPSRVEVFSAERGGYQISYSGVPLDNAALHLWRVDGQIAVLVKSPSQHPLPQFEREGRGISGRGIDSHAAGAAGQGRGVRRARGKNNRFSWYFRPAGLACRPAHQTE